MPRALACSHSSFSRSSLSCPSAPQLVVRPDARAATPAPEAPEAVVAREVGLRRRTTRSPQNEMPRGPAVMVSRSIPTDSFLGGFVAYLA